ncbi:polymer-forming cytoskeletal protein [Patescibacteria group bacterium]|nr:polymer-forming cytoskeletal protein [Patescibacteria group bacterium]
MFKGSSKGEDEEEIRPQGGETIIGVSVKLEGDFKSEGDVAINGEVSGTINTQEDLSIGETAIVKANIEARNVIVAGKVEGNIKAHEKLEIRSSGKITGDVEVANLEIADGSYFNGQCKMGDGSTASLDDVESSD